MDSSMFREPKTREELEAVQRVLQDTHDHYEQYGFNIVTFGTEKGRTCHIGGIRVSAGVDPFPRETDAEKEFITDEGDGPELTHALELADEAAREIARKRRIVRAVQQSGARSFSRPGAFIEALGYYERRHPEDIRRPYMNSMEEKQAALATIRHALTLVHKKLEALSA